MGNSANNSGFGFRILKVQANSPSYEVGLQPFLDFIVNIELTDSELKEASISNIQEFFNTIKASEDKEIHVTIFNIYNRQLRKIKMVPNKNWPNADSLLGALLRYEEYITALERTYKVIQVLPDSVAEKLGLVEGSDYIIGITNYQYKDLNEFIRVLFKAEEICVFNSQKNQIKFINMPNQKCQLGCQFGEGILNQLPYKRFPMSLVEESQKSDLPISEEIVNLTDANETITEVNPPDIKSKSPKNEIIEAPPKKNEMRKESFEHKSGIRLEDQKESKNYEELLKPTISKSTLEYIHHKRSEQLKKNGAATRFTPKNPFSSPKYLNEQGRNEKTLDDIEHLLENDKTINDKTEKLDEKPSQNEMIENNKKEESITQIDEKSKEVGNNFEGSTSDKKEEVESKPTENGRLGKMIMKYSYYCPKIKSEYVINSCELWPMTIKIE